MIKLAIIFSFVTLVFAGRMAYKTFNLTKTYAVNATILTNTIEKGKLDKKGLYYISKEEYEKIDSEMKSIFDLIPVEISQDDLEQHGDELTAISKELDCQILGEDEKQTKTLI